MLQHIGGIPQDMNFSVQQVQTIAGTLKDPVAIRASYAKNILNRDPIGKPGERFAYSNAGYALLGHIAERVGKKPFEKLMEEKVFMLIGMKSALCGMPGDPGMPSGPGQPHGHFPMESGPRPGKLGGSLTHMAVPAGAGIACSIEDLNRYTVWHMRGFLGEKVPGMKPEIIKRLHTPIKQSGGESYAAGWSVSPLRHGHNGSDGTFLAEMAFFPEHKLVVVSICNMGNEDESAPLQAVMAVQKRVIGK
jgi:CubicO group peptidase (beta-lactamase class C family)